MKHAFLITAYKEPELLLSLVNNLAGPGSRIYIGIDKKSALAHDPLLHVIENINGVTLLKPLSIVHWGGFSHLHSILKLAREAMKDIEIGYFHTLSSQCFPTTTKATFYSFFESNRGNEYMSIMKLPTPAWGNGGLDRIEFFHLNDVFDPQGKIFKTLNPLFLRLQAQLGIMRRMPRYLPELYGGGTWWSLSRDAVEYVLNMIDIHPILLRRFKFTLCAEEIFFQSLLMNSPFKEKVVNNDLRYIDWNFKNGSCPAVLDASDLEKIHNSKKMFARKLESKRSKTLMTALAYVPPKSDRGNA